MKEKRAWLLLSLQLSGEATPEELEELDTLLQQHPEWGLQVETIRNMWRSRQPLPADNKTEKFNKHLQRLSNHLSEPVLQYETAAEEVQPEMNVVEMEPRTRSLRWLWLAGGIAASVLILFLLFTMESRNNVAASRQVAGNSVSTKPGSKSKIELPDGTQVWLNADSKLTYDPNFPGTIREVTLTGEAYFDVVKDKTRPFIIHTRSIDVKVLGTAFNVRSYPEEKTTETALIRGSVEITLHNNPDKKIILKPNEKLVVNNVTASEDSLSEPVAPVTEEPLLTLGKIRFNKKDSSSSVETMWVNNKLAFENEVFEKMIPEIERWYNVKLIIKNERLNDLHFTGIFEKKSLAEVMEALRYSGQFQFEIRDGEVTVW